MPNRLAQETSPYLLQHAGNPVDWYPWGEEALRRAQVEDKPILLSIGYSACHWCHVMARQCFENQGIAGLMNEHFINIKVDREERPDIDSIYMEAVQAMTGSGGWPLTVFLTPKGSPFFGGAYFPPEDRGGFPGFPRVLLAVAEAYRNRRSDIEQTVSELAIALSRRNMATGTVAEPLTIDILRNAYADIRQNFDYNNGGFGTAPKFPQSQALEFLLRYAHRFRETAALDMVELTLNKMLRGGIYDQLGGGFHRYSTDQCWLVPHFEKMLYDNALLSQLYLHAYVVTGKTVYRRIAEQTLDYVLREMTAPEGGFYSTQDADSEGAEGRYYLWTEQEIIDVLGKDIGAVASRYFGVTPSGDFDGRSILHVADDSNVDANVIEQAKAALLTRREQRVKPGRDEKVLASWNGLMLVTMAEAACVLGREDYQAAAVANGSFLLSAMSANGTLNHSFRNGQSRIGGYLQDYAMVIEGLLALHQATLQGEWLAQAIRLGEIMVARFWDGGMLYDSSREQQDLYIRPRSLFDEALPSGPSAATMVLLKLARITDNDLFQQVAVQSLRSVVELVRQYPMGLCHWLGALDCYLSPPQDIVIVGPRKSAATLELLHTVCAAWLPDKVVVAHDPNAPDAVPGVKLLEGKYLVDSKPTAYVCQSYTCREPITDAALLQAQFH